MIYNSKRSYIFPDDIGMFFQSFKTEEMIRDLPYLAKEFREHCHPEKIDEELEQKTTMPLSKTCENEIWYLFRHLYNSATTGNEDAVALLKYLYETYHRNEYRGMRDYEKLSKDILYTLYQRYDTVDTSYRLLMMAPFYQKEFDPGFEKLLRSQNTERKQSDNQNATVDTQKIAEARVLATHYTDAEIEKIRRQIRKNIDGDATLYIDHVLSFFAINEDYIDNAISGLPPEAMTEIGCTEEYLAMDEVFLKDLNEYSRKVICADRLRIIALLAGTIFSINNGARRNAANYLCGMLPEPIMYKENKVKYPAKEEIKVEEIKPTTPSKDESREEIERLQRQLSQAKGEITFLKEQLSKEKQKVKEGKEKSLAAKREHEELLRLRDFYFRLQKEEEKPSVTGPSVEQMEKELRKKNIVIVGGNQNWVKKIKQRLPDCKFIDRAPSPTTSTNVLLKADLVVFFTDTLSHSSYYRFVGVCLEKNIPFSYLHGVNLESNIRDLYESLTKK